MLYQFLLALFILAASFSEAATNTLPTKIAINHKIVSDSRIPEGYKGYSFSCPQLTGLSEKRKVILMRKNLDHSISQEFLVLEKNGDLSMESEKGKVPFILAIGTYGYGEPFELMLIPADKKNNPISNPQEIGYCKIIPNPLEVIDEKNRKLSIEARDDTGKSFLVTFSNAEPSFPITITSKSCDEEFSHPHQTDENGTMVFLHAPAVIGKKEGPFEITISSSTMKPLTLRHYWGDIAFSSPEKYKMLKDRFK